MRAGGPSLLSGAGLTAGGSVQELELGLGSTICKAISEVVQLSVVSEFNRTAG